MRSWISHLVNDSHSIATDPPPTPYTLLHYPHPPQAIQFYKGRLFEPFSGLILNSSVSICMEQR